MKSKKEVENWKLKISSVGFTKDLAQVFPILVLVASDYLENPSNISSSSSINENSFEVQSFKHYFNVK